MTYASNTNTNPTKPFTRGANNSDVQIELSTPSLTKACITIYPYYDIDNLRITISYLNSKGNVISTESKMIGNVKEGQEYNTYLSLLDIPLTADEYSVAVSGGTISYFQ